MVCITRMQNLNRAAIKYIAGTIKTGMNLRDIKTLCEDYLLKNGADSFWYWDVGAFVFAGNETAISISGKGAQGFFISLLFCRKVGWAGLALPAVM